MNGSAACRTIIGVPKSVYCFNCREKWLRLSLLAKILLGLVFDSEQSLELLEIFSAQRDFDL